MAKQTNSTADMNSKYEVLLDKALMQLKKLKAENKALKEKQCDVAVTGMSCRMPMSGDSYEQFWQNLMANTDCVQSLPKERITERFHGYKQDESLTNASYIDQPYMFDQQFFEIPAIEASNMDPQHRLLLQETLHALEDACIIPETIRGKRVGVFVGMMNQDYLQASMQSPDSLSAFTPLGNSMGVAAGRISHYFDFNGPSIGLDTNCSSSLVALDLAQKSLQSYECDLAIVGGVNLLLLPTMTEIMTKASALSPDGRSKSFADCADGYGRGEGGAVVILERMSDANSRGAPVACKILSSIVQHDGCSSGLSVPNGLAQQRLINEALTKANLSPDSIDYIESHGTGTSLGDPIELDALQTVFSKRKQPLYLGSVKSNIGHLEAAAGLAGFIKIILSMKQGYIPATIHASPLTSQFDWNNSTLKVVEDNIAWPNTQDVRRAGISSFGFGGTLAHTIVEQAPARERPAAVLAARPYQLLCLSAKSEKALWALRDKYYDFLAQKTDFDIGDIAYTAAVGRTHFPYRLAVQGDTPNALAKALAGMDSNEATTEALINPQCAWLFSGQGSQYAGMGKSLYSKEPIFREALDKCATLLSEELDYPLLEILWGEHSELIDETQYTQPALFALGYSLARLWMSWGLKPSVVMGHSVGEYIAACVAGVFDLASGIRLIAARGRLMQYQTEAGAMAVVFAPAIKVEAALASIAHKGVSKDVSIGAYNGPENTVVSGAVDGVDAVLEALSEYRHHRLSVSRGFHSPLMDTMLDAFREVAESINYQRPSLDLVSNVTGQCEDIALCEASYWVDHVRAPVRFAESMKTLAGMDAEVYLELGPSHTLIGMGRQCGVEGRCWVSSLVSGEADGNSILNALSALYTSGVPLDWEAYYRDRGHWRVQLPTYAFQGQDYRLPSLASSTVSTINADQDMQLFNARWLPCSHDFLKNAIETNTVEKKGNDHSQDHWFFLDQNDLLASALKDKMTGTVSVIELLDNLDFSNTASNFEACPQLVKRLKNLNLVDNQKCHITLVIDHTINDKHESFDTSLFEKIEENIYSIMTTLFSVLSLEKISTQIKVHIITIGNSVTCCEKEDLSLSPILGLVKVLAHEYTQILGTFCHLIKQNLIESLDTLNKLLLDDNGGIFALESGQLLSQVVQHLPEEHNNNVVNQTVSKQAAYLITGGLGAVGFVTAKWIAEQSPGKLYLVGRGELIGEKQQRFNQLKALTDVEYRQLDTADYSSLKTFFDDFLDKSIKEKMPLKGIIHAAGVLNDRLLSAHDKTSFYRTYPAKIHSSWYLHELSQPFELDFFILFSSVATTFGSAGQGNYASANGFLEALAHHRRQLGQAATTVNWGAWDIGMVGELSEQDKQRLRDKGLGFIKEDQGIGLLSNVLTSQKDAVIDAAVIHFQRYDDVLNNVITKRMIEQIKSTNIVRSSDIGSSSHFTHESSTQDSVISLKDEIKALPVDAREAMISSILRKNIMALLGNTDKSISDDEDLLNNKFDSLVVMDLSNTIQKQFDIAFFPREFYANSSIEKLTKHILAEIDTETQEFDTSKSIDFSIKDISSASELDNVDESGEKLPQMVFLLSSPRAGSTLLRAMLAGHSQLFAPPELHLLPYYDMAERNVELEKSLQSGLQRAVMELFSMDVSESDKYINSLLENKKTVKDVYSELINAAGNKLLVDKSPTYAISPYALSRAEKLFDKPKYIYLVRHPYSVIDSFVQLRMDKFASMLKGSGQETPYEIAEKSWTISNHNITEFIEKHQLQDRVHVVQYEELVANPIDQLFEICQFMGVSFEQSLLTPFAEGRMNDGIHKETIAVGDPNFSKHKDIEPALGEKWKTIELPRVLEKSSYQLAKTLGYECPKEDALMSQEPESAEGREVFIERGNMSICFHEWGDASGQPIVLIHGILEQGLVWENIAQKLAEQGFWVLAPDLRGHVKSEWQGSLHLIDFIDDLSFFISEYIKKPVSLVAHSFGALVSSFLAFSRKDLVSNLLLIEPYVPNQSDSASALNLLTDSQGQKKTIVSELDSIEQLAQRLKQSQENLSEDFAQRLAARAHKVNENEKVVWNYNPDLMIRKINTLGFDETVFKKAILDVVSKLPTQFLFSKDEKTHLIFNKLFSNHNKIDVDFVEGGHNLHIDSPDFIAGKIISLAMHEGSKKILEVEEVLS